jgi:GAF domain-containing protein
MLLDPDAGVLRVGAVTGCPLPSGFEVPVGSGYSGRVAATGRPVFVADVGAEPGGVMSPRDREQGIRTYWDTAHTPSPREIRLLQGFGQHAAVALERGRLHEAAEGRVRSLQALTHVAKLISSSLDRDDVLREIARAAARLMKAPLSLICVADEDRRALEVIAFSTPEAGADFPFRKLRFDEGILGWIATHREPVSVPDVFADGRFVAREWWRAQGLQSFYGMPIVLDGALLAVLALNGREPFHLAPEQRELLDSLVAQAAVAIRNALAYRAEGEARVAAEAALAHVKQLQGMLPICSYCKKIRNDRNYWVQIETYISERSEAAFSHSICPECHDTIVGPQLREWRRSQEPGGAPPPAR